MNISHALQSAGLFVIHDSRAKHRRADAPQTIEVAYVGTEDIMQTISEAVSLYPCPMVLILNTGQVMVLAEMSKAGIAVQGEQGNETPEQLAALETTLVTLNELLGFTPKTATKKRSKKATTAEATTEPQEAETVAGEATNPDTTQDAPQSEPEANDGEQG